MTQISIVGHKNPDTDSVIAPLIMKDFLTKKWYTPTVYIQWEINKETAYLIEKYGFETPEIQSSLNPEIEVCLVDHNESSQAPDNLKELNVTWLVDHHRMDFHSSTALYIRVEPLCSSASILYKMYREVGFEISPEVATMMLACIMSDSLLWKSPTTTAEDKAIASDLQSIAGISDLEAFAMPMFEAKSDLGDMPVKDLIQYDYKNSEFGPYKIGIGTLETTNPEYALGRKEEIVRGLEELKTEQSLEFIMLSIIDILAEENTTIVLEGKDTKILEEVFGCHVHENQASLGARLSRKKQIAPDLTDYFNSL